MPRPRARAPVIAIFWHKKWKAPPRSKRKLVTPPPSPTPGIQLPVPRHPNPGKSLAAFWHKKWRPKPRDRKKGVVPAPPTPPASVTQSSSPRRVPRFKRDIFRWKWSPRTVKTGTAFIPPPPPNPIIATYKPLRMKPGARAAFWRRKPPRRPRKRYGTVTFTDASRLQIQLVARYGWFPRARKKYAAPISGTPMVIPLANVTWSWIGNGLAINAKSAISLAQKTWAWTGTGLNVNARNAVTLGQKAWIWIGTGPIVSTSFTLVNLSQTIWRWIGSGLSVNPVAPTPPTPVIPIPSLNEATSYSFYFTGSTISFITYDTVGLILLVQYVSGATWYYTQIPQYVPLGIRESNPPELYLANWKQNRVIPPANALP